LSGTGGATFTVTPNTSIAPSGTKWSIQVCSQANPAPCFTQLVSISGASQTVTLTPPGIRINAQSPTLRITAYQDIEVINGSYGTTYYNLTATNLRICTTVTVGVCTYTAVGAGAGSLITRTIANDNSTGTVLNQLTCLTATGKAVNCPTTAGALSQIVGVCSAGCGTSGTGTVTILGQASVQLDGAGTTADFVTGSTVTPGYGHDSGATFPTGTEVLGQITDATQCVANLCPVYFLSPNTAGGGGGLPSAVAAGQFPFSTGAGTTYTTDNPAVLTWSSPLCGGCTNKAFFSNYAPTFTTDIGVSTPIISLLSYTNNGTSGVGCTIGGTQCSGPYATHFKSIAQGTGNTFDAIAVWGETVFNSSNPSFTSQMLGMDSTVSQANSGHILQATNYQAEHVDTGSGTVDIWESFRSWVPPNNGGNVTKFVAFLSENLANYTAPPNTKYWANYNNQLPSFSGGAFYVGGSNAAAQYTGSTGGDPVGFGPVEIFGSSACELSGVASAPTVLNTGSTTTDTGQNCLPVGATIDYVTYAVNTTITTATQFQIGDATTPGRFSGALSANPCAGQFTGGLTAGSRGVCFVQADQTGAAGPRQTAAAKIRITTNSNPGAGSIRIFVHWRNAEPPAN
jgi:hypothetical protein